MRKSNLERLALPALIALLLVFTNGNATAMHIMEGFLPPIWCIVWGAVSLPFVIWGLSSISKTVKANGRVKLLLAMVGAYAFVLSALKIPSVTGSCSHPTGMGLGAILFGPAPMAVIGLIVLLFQAILLAHGGLTTLGANLFSMAIVGPFVAFGVYKLSLLLKAKRGLAVFLAASLGSLATYVVTSVQLALAFPAQVGGFSASLLKFGSIFALTQIPLSISEGLLTMLIFNFIKTYNHDELVELKVLNV